MHLISKKRMVINGFNLHNALGVFVETGYINIFLQLAHFLIDFNIYVDVRMRRVFAQKRFNAKLEIFMGTAGGQTHRPIDVGKSRRPMSTLSRKITHVFGEQQVIEKSRNVKKFKCQAQRTSLKLLLKNSCD